MSRLRTGVIAAIVISSASLACGGVEESSGATTQDLYGAFTDLSQVELQYPENLNRPLTAADITIVKGYDGKTPEEVATTVRANFVGKLDSSFEDFIHDRILAVHKQWTLVIANCFTKNFPAAKFVQTVATEGTQVFIIGTPRGEIFLETTNPDDGEQWYYAKGNSFEPLAVAAGFKPFTPPIMTAELRLVPSEGIRIEYPQWKWAPLANKPVIIEGP